MQDSLHPRGYSSQKEEDEATKRAALPGSVKKSKPTQARMPVPHGILPGTLVICAALAGALLLSSCAVPSQDHDGNSKKVAPYNPYPPGILPSNLVSEIERVRREVTSIENEALAEWRALPPPTLTGQPPTLQGTGMRANQLL